MRIELATIADCGAIAEVHVLSWQRAYAGIMPASYLASLSVRARELQWRHDMSEQHLQSTFVARLCTQITGFAVVGPCRDAGAPAGRGELWAIYVRPDHWSTGVGYQLWLAGLCRLRASGYRTVATWVLTANQRAIKFYTRVGFTAKAGSHKQVERGGVTLDAVRYLYRRTAE